MKFVEYLLTPKDPWIFWCKITKNYPLLKKEPIIIFCVATQDRVFPHYVPNSSIKHSKSDSKDRSQEIL
jgi:hypothetical protein